MAQPFLTLTAKAAVGGRAAMTRAARVMRRINAGESGFLGVGHPAAIAESKLTAELCQDIFVYPEHILPTKKAAVGGRAAMTRAARVMRKINAGESGFLSDSWCWAPSGCLEHILPTAKAAVRGKAAITRTARVTGRQVLVNLDLVLVIQ